MGVTTAAATTNNDILKSTAAWRVDNKTGGKSITIHNSMRAY